MQRALTRGFSSFEVWDGPAAPLWWIARQRALRRDAFVVLVRMFDAIFKLARSKRKFDGDMVRASGGVYPARRIVLDCLADLKSVLCNFVAQRRCHGLITRSVTRTNPGTFDGLDH